MNKKNWIYGLLIVLLSSAVFWWIYSHRSSQTNDFHTPNAPQPTSSTSGTNKEKKNNQANVQPNQFKGLKALALLLKMAGAKTVPSADKLLKDAVTSGNKVQILRAFHDLIYDRF